MEERSKISLGSCLSAIGLVGVVVVILIYAHSCQSSGKFDEISQQVTQMIDARNPAAPAPTPATCVTSHNLTGAWHTQYQCSENRGAHFSGNETVHVSQIGTVINFRADGDETVYTGNICADAVTWSGHSADYSETGTWKLTDENHFTKSATFTRTDRAGGGNGECTGSGVRN